MTLAETSLLEEPDCRPQPTAKPARERGGARDVIVPLPADFRLASGERLKQPHVIGRLHGRAGAPVVVVAGGISAGRFVHRTETNGLGWWSGAVSVRGPIDLSRLQVLAVDFAPGADDVIRSAGAEAYFQEYYPTIFAVGPDGKFAAKLDHKLVKIQINGLGAYAGYDRALVVQELRRLRAAALRT